MTSSNSPQWHGIIYILLGAFCFSLAIPFIRWTHDLNTGTIVFWRAMFGFLFLSTLLTRQREPVQVASYRQSWRSLLALGVSVSATVLFYTYAVQHTTAATAALLVNSAPVYVAALGPILLHEPRPRYTGISLILAFTGMILVSDPAQLNVKSGGLGGILAAAASGVTYASTMMVSRSLRGRVTGLTQNLWAMALLVTIMIPWALQADARVTLDNMPVLIPLGIFSLGMSYMLYFLGLARVSAQVVSIVSLAEPVFGVMMGMIFFAEVPNALGWFGGGLILFSITLISGRASVRPRLRPRYQQESP